MENKTAEDNREKPDWGKWIKNRAFKGHDLDIENTVVSVEAADDFCETIWNDYVTPLQSRIAQLEKELRYKGIAIEELSQTANQRHNHIQALEKELEDQQRWIPVSERLPAKFVKVLVFGSCGNIAVSCTDASGKIDEYVLWENEHCTHWQPLPTPPPL